MFNYIFFIFTFRYYETSAATGDGVDRLFQDILLSIIERKKLWKKANSAAQPL